MTNKRKPSIPVIWSKHLQEKSDKDEFLKVLQASPRVLRRLNEIIEEYIQASIHKTEVESSFETHNWSEYQAYLIGERKGLRKIQELLRFIK